ncbi:hypothetical protein HDV00_005411 [Rhizophlyctis rosea]|nr:hypothetical protein HDV00_005411 [Rhizophlyctis rosea]
MKAESCSGRPPPSHAVIRLLALSYILISSFAPGLGAPSSPLIARQNEQQRIVTYFGNWYEYNAAYPVYDTASLTYQAGRGLTHLNYAFATISYSPSYDTYFIQPTDPWADYGRPEPGLDNCYQAGGGFNITSLLCNGEVSFVPYVGACETAKRAGDDCFNDQGGGDPRVCLPRMTQASAVGSVCGYFGLINQVWKREVPSVRYVASLGGWYDSQYFSGACDDKYIDKFVTSIVRYVVELGFDGIDIDWEYPGFEHGGSKVTPNGRTPAGTPDDIVDCITDPTQCVGNHSDDQAKFGRLITKLRAAFDRVNGGLNRLDEKWVVSFAAPAGADKIAFFEGLDRWEEHLSFINLMTYDLYGAGWSPVTNHQAALHPHLPNTAISVSTAVDEWTRVGLPAKKITIGLPFYARVWAFSSPISASTPISSLLYASGGVPPNAVDSIVAYNSIPLGDMDVEFDDVAGATWGVDRGAGRFYSFDNDVSIKEKVAWGKAKGIGGWMAWAAQMDKQAGGGWELFDFLTNPKYETYSSHTHSGYDNHHSYDLDHRINQYNHQHYHQHYHHCYQYCYHHYHEACPYHDVLHFYHYEDKSRSSSGDHNKDHNHHTKNRSNPCAANHQDNNHSAPTANINIDSSSSYQLVPERSCPSGYCFECG